MGWMNQAACADTAVDLTKYFFSMKKHEQSVAKMICNVCPVKEQCKEEFWKEEYGIYAGFTAAERLEQTTRGLG